MTRGRFAARGQPKVVNGDRAADRLGLWLLEVGTLLWKHLLTVTCYSSAKCQHIIFHHYEKQGNLGRQVACNPGWEPDGRYLSYIGV